MGTAYIQEDQQVAIPCMHSPHLNLPPPPAHLHSPILTLTPSLLTIPLPLYLVSTAGPVNHLLLLQEHLVLVDGREVGPVLLPHLIQVLNLCLEVMDPLTDLQTFM